MMKKAPCDIQGCSQLHPILAFEFQMTPLDRVPLGQIEAHMVSYFELAGYTSVTEALEDGKPWKAHRRGDADTRIVCVNG